MGRNAGGADEAALREAWQTEASSTLDHGTKLMMVSLHIDYIYEYITTISISLYINTQLCSIIIPCIYIFRFSL